MPPRRGTAPEPADPDHPPRPCESPGCPNPGEYRAPRSRTSLNEYRWFCLPHVREYNAAWDYYKGMGPNEIEANLRADTAWQRPTWPLGRLGGSRRFDPEFLRDPLGLLYDTPLHAKRARPAERKAEAPPELRAALDVLGLEWPLEPPALRARYKELAKRYHPDANGGDRGAEDKLKDVNRAYSLLRQRLGRGRAAPAAAE
ncbi:J domain-containing protein [Siccirubricoccus sp. KC 17139]|uniref:J domain-containing protein n=1 Tax=Siccirubricoccus soli TaxID=2899147 RepID=A0ABT1D0K3_9PROT|nr:J domain-containing protein [Siccirubricoccus soli]MCO6415407.1 J domain-containing protein [Siccirubricoccus soli]MCP2681539.1 J domain-containing protein [Siccirubricoccus soli]